MRRIFLAPSVVIALACAGLGKPKDEAQTDSVVETDADTDADADADADGDADTDADTDTDTDADTDSDTDSDTDADGDSDTDTDTDTDVETDPDSDGDGYVASVDCDDTNRAVNPGATEVCNGIDDDCDGRVDPASSSGSTTWYVDDDGDGWGDTSRPVTACEHGSDEAERSGDCDDSDAAVSPDATEACNDIDDDCDGVVDPEGSVGASTWYLDADGDLYGDPSYAVTDCSPPTSFFVDNGDDCDDDDDTINPLAFDDCGDSVDDNCDGDVDESCTADLDGDGFDLTEGDCDDEDATSYPGADEGSTPDVDNDCSGVESAVPVAIATASGSTTCSDLGLDGSDSYDLGGLALSYEWELVSAPAGSALDSTDIDTITDVAPEFHPDVDGDYTFALVVDNGDVESLADELTVTVTDRATNTSPVARAGSDQSTSGSADCTPISYGVDYDCNDCGDVVFNLSASGSSDADGDALSYTWTVVSGSAYATLSSSTAAATRLTVGGVPTTFGVATETEVQVQLTVTDCVGASSSDTLVVRYTCTGT